MPNNTPPATDDDWEASGEGWADAVTNIGKPVDFSKTPVFRGIFVENSFTANSEGEEFPIVSLAGTDGVLCFAWGSPELRHAFRTIPAGSQVQITHLGKEDIGHGRTVNRFDVKYRPPVGATE